MTTGANMAEQRDTRTTASGARTRHCLPARRPGSGSRTESRTRAERILIGLELSTGAAALVSGALLAARPDGSFLHASPRVLQRTPFSDWRVPGLLLAGGCGGGYLIAGTLQLIRHPAAPLVSVAAGVVLVGLEVWETAVIEFQPLEAVYAAVGGAVAALGLRGIVSGRYWSISGRDWRRADGGA